MTKEERQTAEELERLTNEALAAALADPKQDDDGGPSWSVNWGDLHCVDVVWMDTLHSGQFWRIEIEEASPKASSLQAFVSRYLMDRGYASIVIATRQCGTTAEW